MHCYKQANHFTGLSGLALVLFVNTIVELSEMKVHFTTNGKQIVLDEYRFGSQRLKRCNPSVTRTLADEERATAATTAADASIVSYTTMKIVTALRGFVWAEGRD